MSPAGAGAPAAGATAAASSPPLVAIFRRTTAAPSGGLPPAQRRLPGGGGSDVTGASNGATRSPAKIRNAGGRLPSVLAREAWLGREAAGRGGGGAWGGAGRWEGRGVEGLRMGSTQRSGRRRQC